MLNIEISSSLLFCLLPLFLLFLISFIFTFRSSKESSSEQLPRSYPVIGSYPSILANKDRLIQWTSDIVRSSPDLTFTLRRPLGYCQVYTANPATVQHILKSHFSVYEKGDIFRATLSDFLGDGIFNSDGDKWKFQRQMSSHEFNTKSLRKYVETVVDTELSQRLIPILAAAAADKTVLDLQDILQRFAFDNICKIAFGYDPQYLLPSLPVAEFAVAFENATRISSDRFSSPFPLIWKIKRALNIGAEKKLSSAVRHVREFAQEIVKEKKQELKENSELESGDLLSRFLSSGHSDETFVTDIVISFILAGRDTTSAALTWFFWLVYSHPEVEKGILREIREKSESPLYDEVKDMTYTHASLCETMRLYPPVPSDTKEAAKDDVLPDGTVVRKGTRVTYHPYAMGRVEAEWGSDWGSFRPERWLERDAQSPGKWKFVAKDSYHYPVFQAGPRICLGKEFAFLQMQRVVAGVLRQFRVVPATQEGGAEPVFISYLTTKMKGGFPVRILERVIN